MPLLEGSSDDIIKKNIEELMSTGKYTAEQAAAIAYEKAGRKPKVNASEPTYEYLQAVWAILKERPDVFEDIKAEVHKTARASAGGTMKAKYAKEALDGKEKEAQGTMLKANLDGKIRVTFINDK